mmetsp:Transcript_37199/g.83793  ORF Transcript_37199/g.83793 Transcript_37199/m.83793 type:complete len:412 (+) Transcript_37199:1-1236(+)
MMSQQTAEANKIMLMHLETEQTANLPYPVECNVWVVEPNSSLLKRGLVNSVSFNPLTKEMIYDIVEGDSAVGAFPESRLAYGPGCSVSASIDEKTVVSGTVLQYDPRGERPKYAIMSSTGDGTTHTFYEGIDARRVKYRRTSLEVLVTKESTDSKSSEVSTKETNQGGRRGSTVSISTPTANSRAVSHGGVRHHGQALNFNVYLPSWLFDPLGSDDLFVYLNCPRSNSPNILSSIGERNGCELETRAGIEGPAGHFGHAHVFIRSLRKDASKDDLMRAKAELEDALVDFMRRDNARGLLFYDIARYNGMLHQNFRGEFLVVQQRTPSFRGFGAFGRNSFMTIMPLTSGCKVGRLLSPKLLSEVRRIGCRVQFVGQQFRAASQWSDDHACIVGSRPKDVNQAAMMIADALTD